MSWRMSTLTWLAMAAGAAPLRGDDPPPVFDKRPYAEAQKAADDQKKWFIVDATAVWCLPCKRMEGTTWRDEKVVKWLGEHAITVTIDVDQEANLAKQLAIEAMPTIIAFRAGKEVDRVVGYQSPADFLAWLEGITRGEKSIDAIKKRAGTREGGQGSVNIQARLDLARKFAQSGKYDEAADEYAWLWEHMLEHDRAYYGVRLSFMAGDMERLAAKRTVAKQRFTELRNRAAKAVEGDKADREAVVDWITLNRILGDSQATLAWFDQVKDQARWQPLLNEAASDLQELLIEAKRWPDVARLYPDPVAELEQEHALQVLMRGHEPPKGLSEEQRKELEELPKRMLREKVGTIYAALLAAGRDQDAGKVAARARDLDDSPAMIAALVSTACKAGQPRKQHLEWIDSISKPDGALTELRNRVKTALDGK